MRTAYFSGHLFCNHAPCHTCLCHACPYHTCPPATHAPYHACPPLPCTPPSPGIHLCHTHHPFTIHTPFCHTCLSHSPPDRILATRLWKHYLPQLLLRLVIIGWRHPCVWRLLLGEILDPPLDRYVIFVLLIIYKKVSRPNVFCVESSFSSWEPKPVPEICVNYGNHCVSPPCNTKKPWWVTTPDI